MKRYLFLTPLLLFASTAIAQDGAIDMTGMGIYAQEDAMMDAARGSGDRAPAETARVRKTKANCARVPEFRRHFGPRDARIQKITALCRKLGYPTG